MKACIIVTHIRTKLQPENRWTKWRKYRYFKYHYIDKASAEDALKQSVWAKDNDTFQFHHQVIELEFNIIQPEN